MDVMKTNTDSQRKCWWDGVDVEIPASTKAKGETMKVKVWARRVWTLELSLVSCSAGDISACNSSLGCVICGVELTVALIANSSLNHPGGVKHTRSRAHGR